MSATRTTVLLIAFGLVSAVVGVVALIHPAAFFADEGPHHGFGPPWGASFLAVPVVLIGIGLRRLWDEITLDAEAHEQRHLHDAEERENARRRECS